MVLSRTHPLSIATLMPLTQQDLPHVHGNVGQLPIITHTADLTPGMTMNIFLSLILNTPIITKLTDMLERLADEWASTNERRRLRCIKIRRYQSSRNVNALLALCIVFCNRTEAMEISNIVANEKMAAELAEVYIANIYGKQAAERQKPYLVTEVEGYWTVKGVMQKRQLGGTFDIHIAKEDGRILLLMHSR